jgi:hypothetical protein
MFAGPGGGGGGGRVLYQSAETRSCPISVEPGLAEDWLLTRSPLGYGSGVQPAMPHATEHRGIVALLDRPFMLDKAAANCPTPEFVHPTNNRRINNVRPVLEVSARDSTGDDKMEIFVDGTALGEAALDDQSNTWKIPLTRDLGEGEHAAKAKFFCREASPSEVTIVFYVDVTKPGVTIASGPSGYVSSSTAEFAFGSNEQNVSFECLLNPGTATSFTACPNPPVFSRLSEGLQVLKVRARDQAGNVSDTPAERSWTVDTVRPNTTITDGPPAHDSSNSATFVLSSNEQEVIFECQLDPEPTSPFTACPNPPVFSGLSEGPHVLKVRARDRANNFDDTPAERSWRVDVSPPTTIIQSGPRTHEPAVTATFVFTSDEPNVTYECQLDQAANGPFTPCPSPPTFSGLAQGPHTLRVRAKDEDGDVDESPAEYNWNVDTVRPGTTISTATPLHSPSRQATFTFSSNEANVSYECRLNSTNEGDFTACPEAHSITVPADGAYILEVRAKDLAGNRDDNPERFSWNVDTMKPETRIGSGLPQWTNSESLTFTFSSDEGNVSYECRLSSAFEQGFVACSNPYTYTAPSDGAYILEVRAKDRAGNLDASPAEHRWNLDRVPPETSITGKPQELTRSTSAPFSFTSPDNSATFYCRRDGDSGFQPCTSPLSYTVPEGAHWFEVYAVDRAGNVDGSIEHWDWTVDITPPNTRIDSGPPLYSNSRSAMFRFSIEGPAEQFITYQCKVDTEQDYTLCTSPKAYDNLPPGGRSFFVKATDKAGNTDPSEAIYVWTVDLEAPPPPQIVAPSAGSYINATQLYVTGRAEGQSKLFIFLDDNEPIGPTTVTATGEWALSVDISALSDGTHSLKATSRDEAGNSSEFSEVRQFIVDRTHPEVRIVEGPPVVGNNRTATFRFAASSDATSYECNDGRGFQECPETFSITVTDDGTFSLAVRAVDRAGNRSNPAASRIWKVDTRPPNVSVTSPEEGGRVNVPNPVFAGTAEGEVIVRVFVKDSDGVEQFAGETSAATSGSWRLESAVAVSNGRWFVSAEALDVAGNTSERTAPISFIVDTDPPDTVIVSGPRDPHNSRLVSFVVKSPENARQYLCSLDGFPLFDCRATDCSSSSTEIQNCFSFNLSTTGSKVVNGEHTLQVSAKDDAGNVDPTPAPFSWTVIVRDPEPPRILEPSNGAEVYDLVPTVRGSTEPKGEVVCYLGNTDIKIGIAEANAAGEWSFRPSQEMKEGEYTLRCEVTDEAGNPSKEASQVTFTVFAPKEQAHAVGGGLGCAASGTGSWLALLGLVAGTMLSPRRRRR